MSRRLIVVLASALLLGTTVPVLALCESRGTGELRGIVYTTGGGTIYFATVHGTEPPSLGPRRRLAQGNHPEISPDGRLVAFVRKFPTVVRAGKTISSRGIFVISSRGGVAKLMARVTAKSPSFVWAPNSRNLAIAASDLRVIDVRSGRTEIVSERDVSSPSFSPDGRSLVYAASRGGPIDLYVTDLQTGRARRITDFGDATDPIWGPSEIAFNHYHEIWLIDGEGGHLHQLGAALIDGELYGVPAYWSSDGRRLVAAGIIRRGNVKTIDVRTGSVMFGRAGEARGLSRDGSFVLIDTCSFVPVLGWQPLDLIGTTELPPHGIQVVSLTDGRSTMLVPDHGNCFASWNA